MSSIHCLVIFALHGPRMQVEHAGTAVLLEIAFQQIALKLYKGAHAGGFVRHNGTVHFRAPICDFGEIDPFALAPLIFRKARDSICPPNLYLFSDVAFFGLRRLRS
jgi:hypothetical protein